MDAEMQIRNGHKKSAAKESLGMGEIAAPKMPANLRAIIITVDIDNGNLQVAGPIINEEWCLQQLDRARQEIIKFNQAQKN